MKKKILIAALVSVTLTALVTIFIFQLPTLEPDYEIKTVELKNEKLYLKAKYWGLTGDHAIKVISTDSVKLFIPDSTKDFIYNDLDNIYYKTYPDSIVIYSMLKSKVPQHFNIKIKVVQIELDNVEFIKLRQTYKSLGLKVF